MRKALPAALVALVLSSLSPATLGAWGFNGHRFITERAAVLAPVVDVRPTRITVRDQRTRWGSASRSGALSFSWRLILAPPDVLDSVVVHELAHLRIRGHDRAFWTLVERHAPKTPTARRWLRDHARELRGALD
jgi:hypothetical protein